MPGRMKKVRTDQFSQKKWTPNYRGSISLEGASHHVRHSMTTTTAIITHNLSITNVLKVTHEILLKSTIS